MSIEMTTIPVTSSVTHLPRAKAARLRSRGTSLARLARFRWAISLLSTLALCFAWWALLAPPQLGGQTTFMITEGVSMLPHFHAGDGVVLRHESSYHVGEVAAYHNGQLKAVVMHRIIAIKGDRYVFKGDNNDYFDTFEPTRSQIIGAERYVFPGAARYLITLHKPIVAAVFLALLWLLSFPPVKSQEETGTKGRRLTRKGKAAQVSRPN